ncbi:MAG TPA: DivIVA domain-containing protein [Ignavibacteriaceae bacterium]|jgi:cell division initiation protein|nr:DivIVA domain-containing protein [Ignavibacteriaceae bacterium]
MRISPLSIKRQEFNKSFRGFDKDEVEDFLERLSNDVEEIQNENDSLKKQIEEANGQLTEFKRIEKNLQETLLKAQENSAKSFESAKKQANLLIKEAEIKAEQIIEKSREEADDVRSSIIKLREERDLIIARLKAIIDTQARLLEMKVEKASEDVVHEIKTEAVNKVQIDIDQIIDKLI